MSRILVVDDEVSMREMLGIMLRKEGHEVLSAGSRSEAAGVLRASVVDLVLSDIRLPDGDGLELLRHVKSASPRLPVLIMTAYGSTESAIAALKLGAADYLTKPFDMDELRIVVRNCLERVQLQEENQLLKAELKTRYGPENVIGVSPGMAAVLEMVRTVAGTPSTVLLIGESGTGKEVVARALHTQSPRREAPFVSINCGALPETLLESELFGHMKGSFTDARQDKKGLFEAAHRGTLFLDEVAATPPAMQVKLLRVLQEKSIRRVGSNQELSVDVRLIAATNRPLEELVREGSFRHDLFYRLNVIPIQIPPLRERRQDIPVLAAHFLQRFSREMGKSVTRISTAAMDLLMRHSWPGNVRELENAIERAVALESTPAVLPERLPTPVRALDDEVASPAEAVLQAGFDLERHLGAIESGLVRQALEQSAGDRKAAAQMLGITPRSLRYLLAKHGRPNRG